MYNLKINLKTLIVTDLKYLVSKIFSKCLAVEIF